MRAREDEIIPSETGMEAAAKASHDTQSPQALLDFMVTGWKTPPVRPTPKIRGSQYFAKRRRALSALFPGETLVIPTGHEKTRANDTNYRFRPGTDFYYLTGDLEPDCALVLVPKAGGGHTDVLFVEPNPGKTDKTFFTDRNKGELWVGPRLGVTQSRERYGVDEARPLEDLAPMVRGLDEGNVRRPFRLLRGIDAQLDTLVPPQDERDTAFAEALSELRLLKDPFEVKELRGTIDATHRAFDDVVAALPEAETERYVEGIFNLRARVEGNDVGYNTIAAAGAHACVLHWTHNDGPIREGDLLLLDAGVEATTLYTADVTRTIPISGTFSPEQRAIYQLVLDAQDAAFLECKPGRDFLAPNRAAMRVLAHGLQELGILHDAEEALRDEHQFYKRYSLHNVSHMLGLDVHDCAAARAETYKFGKLRAGMVLTVEPGLYFQKDDLTVPPRFRGIGVRIEDDVLITARGYENLSGNIPRTVIDVEKWVKSGRSGRRRRP